MRSTRALWSLMLPVLAATVALLALGPVPVVRASREAHPLRMPQDVPDVPAEARAGWARRTRSTARSRGRRKCR